ncbi:hypothetical protein Y032_1306g3818 [Ancylostoma ceylanicum]|nr:hypothetical protein Y032_1306g3818 [Ancylostoma ceylanicum]
MLAHVRSSARKHRCRNKHAEAKTALLALEREHIGLKLENEKKRATLLEMQLQNEHWKQEILRSQHNALLNAPAVPHFADL